MHRARGNRPRRGYRRAWHCFVLCRSAIRFCCWRLLQFHMPSGACHRCTARIKTAARYPCRWGRKMIGLKFGCLHCSGAPFPIVSCLLLYRKGHKSEMQKTRIKGKKFVQYLVKVNCETDFLVMLFLAVTNGNVVRAVFCFRLFESALTQVCFKAYFVQPALSPPLPCFTREDLSL